jgi:stearoyl-CoA desaturase (delta-9 desaturase)
MMGESYHNNHHKFGSRANFGGIRWHELDPTYMVIVVLDKLRIIRIAQQKEIVMERVKKAA